MVSATRLGWISFEKSTGDTLMQLELFQVKGMMGETVRAKQNQVKSRSRRAVSEHQSKEKIVCQMQLKEGGEMDGGVTF